MFDNISFSIARFFTLTVQVNHFRKNTVTLNTRCDLTAMPVFQHSVQVFPMSAPAKHTHTNLGLIFLHSARRNIIVTHVLKNIKGLMQVEIKIMQPR